MNSIDICNLGLSMLGGRPILNFEDGERGERLKHLYPAARDYVLGRHTWSQTVRYKRLTSRSEHEGPRWLYEYELPLDCLRIIEIHSPYVAQPTLWERSGDQLLTTVLDPELRYVARLENPVQMGIDIQQLIAIKLAELMAMSITQQPRLSAQFTSKFEHEFVLARSRDLDQHFPDVSGEEPWHQNIHRRSEGMHYDTVRKRRLDVEGGGP